MPTTSKGRGSPPCELREVEPLHVRGAVQQRHLARLHVALDAALDRAPLGIHGVLDRVPLRLRQAGFARRHASLVVAGNPRIPRQDVGVAFDALHANAAGIALPSAGAQIALHVPQRDGQHRHRRPLRRCRTARRRTWRAAACRPVATFSGNAPALASGRPTLSLRSRGTSMVNDVFSGSGAANVTSLTSSALSSLSKTGFRGGAGRPAELHLFRRLPRHGRREPQHHRPHRQARRVRAFALAAELGAERPCEPCSRSVARPSCAPAGCPPRRCPCPRRGARRHRAAAGAGRSASSIRAARLASMRRAFNSASRAGPRHHDHGQALADPFDFAPGIRRRGGRVHRAGQREQEMLVLLDLRRLPTVASTRSPGRRC